jgi:hypothetical protein
MPVRKTVNAGVRIRSAPLVLTPDIVRELIDRAAYISLADQCHCREQRKCAGYPATFGCLYLGEGARASWQKETPWKSTGMRLPDTCEAQPG